MHILIVDDHPLYRDALARVVERSFANVTVTQTASLAAAEAHLNAAPRCDLVMLDLGLPDVEGLAALIALRRRSALQKVVIVSASEDRAQIEACLREGARGFISKSATSAELAQALKRVLAGGMVQASTSSVEARLELGAVEARSNVVSHPASLLSSRERQVLKMVCDGHTNKEIARELAIAEPTVRAHLTAIFRALGVVNRTQAARQARLRGLVEE